MAPAFSNTATRGVLNVFYDSGHKVSLSFISLMNLCMKTLQLKTRWDALFESNGTVTESTIINVQDWYVLKPPCRRRRIHSFLA
jgi:hypothetical protein